MRFNIFLTSILYWVIFLCPGLMAQNDKPGPPNVILIVADDLGYADLGCYGSTFYETPNLDQLARDGSKFTNAYASCPVCSPSRASLQTGKYPVRTGITDWIKGRKSYRDAQPQDRWLALETKYELDLEETTLAEAFKQADYNTYFAGKWHLGEEEKFWPENQGYDLNIGGWRVGAPQRNKDCGGYFAPYCNPRLEGPEGEYLPDRITAETLQFIEKQEKTPFFICLAYYLVHTPLQAKKQLEEKYTVKRTNLGLDSVNEFSRTASWIQSATASRSYKERLVQSDPVYAGMVHSLDENIGKIIRLLKELNLYDNTILLFTSDNGGLSTAEGSPTLNIPLRAGKGWLYEGGIRVPFIVKPQQGQPRAPELAIPASGIDVPLTLMDLAGLNPRSFKGTDGISLRPYLNGQSWKDRPLYWHYPHYSNQGGNPGSVIRWGDYKLYDDFETGKKELYNLKDDIGETKNLAEKLPKTRDKLLKKLEKWRQTNKLAPLKPNPAWDQSDPIVE